MRACSCVSYIARSQLKFHFYTFDHFSFIPFFNTVWITILPFNTVALIYSRVTA